jgi:dUTP pyrophosphatase
VKIGRTAFSSALGFLPLSPRGTRTSPSTTQADEAWTVATEPDPGSNGAWDPLEALREEADVEDPDSAPELGGRAFAAPSTVRSTLAGVEELNFIRLSEQATLPTRAHDSDAGLDLYAAEGARISPGGRVSVGTGLAVAIPEGLAGLVLPRSGLALKHGVTLVNSPGLIDPGYRGEVRVLLHNTDLTSEFRLAAGDRVAQLILIPIAHASPLESDALDSTIRGSGGFGSTGA